MADEATYNDRIDTIREEQYPMLKGTHLRHGIDIMVLADRH